MPRCTHHQLRHLVLMLGANLIVEDAVVDPGLHELCSQGIYVFFTQKTRKIMHIFHNLPQVCLSDADVCPDRSGHASSLPKSMYLVPEVTRPCISRTALP
jgi:hypothetical protein